MSAILVLFVTSLSGSAPQALAITEPMPLPACLALSMPIAAKWAGEHPNLRIRRFACVDPKLIGAILGRHEA